MVDMVDRPARATIITMRATFTHAFVLRAMACMHDVLLALATIITMRATSTRAFVLRATACTHCEPRHVRITHVRHYALRHV